MHLKLHDFSDNILVLKRHFLFIRCFRNWFLNFIEAKKEQTSNIVFAPSKLQPYLQIGEAFRPRSSPSAPSASVRSAGYRLDQNLRLLQTSAVAFLSLPQTLTHAKITYSICLGALCNLALIQRCCDPFPRSMTSGGGGGREGRGEVLMMSNKRARREVTSGAGSVEEALNEDDVRLCVSLWTDAAAIGGRRRREGWGGKKAELKRRERREERTAVKRKRRRKAKNSGT